MADQAPSSGKIVVFARAVAKEGKAEELQGLLQEAVRSANSDKEPYTLTYRCARHGDEFRLFEEWVAHVESTPPNPRAALTLLLCPKVRPGHRARHQVAQYVTRLTVP